MNKAKLKEIGSLLRYLGDLFDSLVEEEPENFKAEEIGTVVAETVEANAQASPTFEEVRAVLGRKSQEGFTDKIREFLTMYGARKLSEVNPGDYENLLALAEGLKHA